VIKSRGMRSAEQLTLAGERRGAYRVLAEKTEIRRPL